ncbi:hypothetical protein TRFO_40588 [Tritrichomonas foetus]|uniref:Uncharacterized protein n=1 Tax=Tritrichomonas foetus TaxID=1144522 RepID=A0A1J4J4N5_9EUKA|nr:hypothetical protein TRFO_40588 [Tritrichomonas foetus]|eukprot:OHS93103.1 hypothetical protein TRFO_40588 [Tritrichomonas foetus]
MFRRAVLAPLQSNQSSDLENPFESCADEDTSFSTEKSYFSDDNSNHHISKTKLAPLEKIETKNDQEAFVADQEDEDDDIISNYTPENSSRSFSDQNNENAVIYQEQSENNEASDGKFDEDLENEDDEISFNISKHIESSQNFMNQIQNEIIDVSSQEVKTEEMQKPDPNLRVTFTPEVHAMAFLNYTRNQYLKSQQCEGYDENEEEEEEYQEIPLPTLVKES